MILEGAGHGAFGPAPFHPSALSMFPPHQIGGSLGHGLDGLPALGDQPLVDPPDIDDRDLTPGIGERDECRLAASHSVLVEEVESGL
ncbi:hypothetical protein [Streptomyces sp. UG1]|uniref:hypothetical protein n=1 Tax=Streptomyces sp. UG1 TaxID=3417652 RepID=UPI003CFADDE8